MHSSSLPGVDESRRLDTACEELERASQCFDGHKQVRKVTTPWDNPIGFDPDELEHEKSLEAPSPFVSVDEMSSADCIPGGECVCGHCPDPRASVEAAEENELFDKISRIMREEGNTQALSVLVQHCIEDYGPAFRRRLVDAGVIR